MPEEIVQGYFLREYFISKSLFKFYVWRIGCIIARYEHVIYASKRWMLHNESHLRWTVD